MKVLLLLALAGCRSFPIGMSQGPPSICSTTNIHPYRVDVFLEDNEGHSEWVRWADPQEHVCTVWDMPGAKGRWVYVSTFATERSFWFYGYTLR